MQKSKLLFGTYSYISNFFLTLDATSQEPNQICVLELGYELDFIFELSEPLPWMWS